MGEDDETEVNEAATTSALRGAERRRSVTHIGERYRIGKRIGRGGMGEVLEAHDELIGRDVAIKRIRAKAPSDQALARFMREAKIQGQLEHPAIVPIHELGVDAEGLPYFAMKKLSGITLGEVLAGTPDPRFGRQRLLRAFADVCLAIEFAHVHGVLHRDIKPSNIVLGEFGEVYVLDWGIAKLIAETETLDEGDGLSDDRLTAAGAVVGTPAYMAPEQAAATDVDARADVFALGRVLADILARDPVPELAVLVERATADERDARPTARALAETIQGFLDGDRDLELRRELARGHLDRARTALAAGDTEAMRSRAMNEAGRAIALDPSLRSAGELVAQLVLTPPRTLPVEIEQTLEQDKHRLGVASTRFGLTIGLVWIIPLVELAAAGHAGAMLGFALALVPMYVGMIAVLRRKRISPPWVLCACSLPTIAAIAYCFSPMLAAPGIAALFGLNFVMHPDLRTPGASLLVGLGFGLALLGPIVLGAIGVIPNGMEAFEGGLLLHGPGLDLGPETPLFMATLPPTMLASAVLFGHFMREQMRRMRTNDLLVRWHFNQLLPHA